MSDEALYTLKHYWGYPGFRPGQADIVEAVIEGKDTLALLPTGGGKSICFQVPGLVREGLTLVISPLIALMNDQVENLKKNGIKAAYVNASLSPRLVDITLDNAANGAYEFLYVSPERLKTRMFKDRLEKMNVGLIAVDEAHCISEWGYDFRPSYLDIQELREKLPKVPVIALTATATPKVAQDIIDKLALQDCAFFQKSFQRENLAYITIATDFKEDRILEYAKRLKGSGIIYTDTRKNTKYLCDLLKRHKITAHYYNGGLSSKERATKQEDWIQNKVKVMVATNAFGMGIDKPDVRFVLHHHIPQSPEAYFQEAGRAGRDLEPSRAILFFEQNDLITLQEKFEQSFPEKAFIRKVYHALGNHFQLAIGAGDQQQFNFDIRNFVKQFEFDFRDTKAALKILEINQLIIVSEAVTQTTKVLFTANKMELYNHQLKYKKHDPLIKLMLRSYPGIFDQYVNLDLARMSAKLKMSAASLVTLLQELDQLKIIELIHSGDSPTLTFTAPRADADIFTIHPEAYENRKVRAREKMEAMLEFLQNKRCRSQFLLGYFGESDAPPCGQCNVCLAIDQKTLENNAQQKLEKHIQKLLSQQNTIPITRLMQLCQPYTERQVKSVILWMEDNGRININESEIAKKVSKG